jgi:hypothetical protein
MSPVQLFRIEVGLTKEGDYFSPIKCKSQVGQPKAGSMLPLDPQAPL